MDFYGIAIYAVIVAKSLEKDMTEVSIVNQLTAQKFKIESRQDNHRLIA